MASILGVPPGDFRRLWLDTFRERTAGVHPTPRDSIAYICRKLDVDVSEARVEQAARVRLDYTVRSFRPRAGAVEVLTRLKSDGYKTGLISDCSGEIPRIWNDTPFTPLLDVTVFSCQAGIKKPDPRIYLMATEQLAVKPEECLYIGDGSSRELTGASQVGMHPVLIRLPDDAEADAHRVDAETDDWDGPEISSLKEVLTLL
jgi:putative hydrolase of the HAD superfamily